MSRTIVLEPGKENVLQLTEPMDYHCRIAGFYGNHDILVVELRPNNAMRPTLYILFAGVYYYDGPTQWDGANLRAASTDENFDFMMNRALVSATQQLSLFGAKQGDVHIFAFPWCGVLDEMPERFR